MKEEKTEKKNEEKREEEKYKDARIEQTGQVLLDKTKRNRMCI